MGEQYGFLLDLDRCVGCHACEVACKSTRGVGPGHNWRKVVEIWRGEFPLVSRAFVSLSCLHCADPPCGGACPVGAISKRAEDGIVTVDRDLCTGCQACYPACPYRVPQFGAGGIMEKCDLCLERGIEPACTAPCPAEALFSGKMRDLELIAARKGVHELKGPGGPSMLIIGRTAGEVPVELLRACEGSDRDPS